MLKRYILQAGTRYYPRQGMGDFIGSFSSVEEAKAAIPLPYTKEEDSYCTWATIFDQTTMAVVFELQDGNEVEQPVTYLHESYKETL